MNNKEILIDTVFEKTMHTKFFVSNGAFIYHETVFSLAKIKKVVYRSRQKKEPLRHSQNRTINYLKETEKNKSI